MSALLEALARSAMDEDGDRRRSSRKTPPDALCITLKEVAERYAAPCPFKPGDLVTPRADTDTKAKGAPHVVLETLARPEPDFRLTEPSDGSSNHFGGRRDMRIACENFEGGISKYWVESNEFGPYTGPGATDD